MLNDTDDSPINFLRAADPPGRPRTSEPRKTCIRGRMRQPTDAADAIVTIDGRTNLGKAARQLRDALVRHLGGNPSAVQLVLVERVIQLTVRLKAMDLDFAATGSMSRHSQNSYLAWSNSLVRTLKELGLEAAPEKPTESLASIVGAITAQRATEAPVGAPPRVPTPDALEGALARPGACLEPDRGVPASAS